MYSQSYCNKQITYFSIVYNPKAPDNEEKSATLYKDFSVDSQPKVFGV